MTSDSPREETSRAPVPASQAAPGEPRPSGALAVPFTARLLGAIDRGPVNAVLSPLSAQIALTMAGIGARGETLAQMEEALGGGIDELAESAAALAGVLARVGSAQREQQREGDADPATASLADGVWAQAGLDLEQSYREQLATAFGADVREVDFADADAREQGRREINDWVAEITHDLIQELVPAGALSAAERLVLVNALHLKAAWTKALTPVDGTFATADGQSLSLSMLQGTATGWYEDEHCRATALPTAGGELALALIQPASGLDALLDAWAAAAAAPGPERADGTDGIDGTGLAAVLSGLAEQPMPVDLTLPGFDIEWEGELNSQLAALGMADAFGAGADFSGIAEEAGIRLSRVLQKAVITVDEQGMEAAAATVVLMRMSLPLTPPQSLLLDAPFLFVAYEQSSLAPLVAGWIGDPTQTR